MRRALVLLILAEVLAYGVFSPSLGFYHDDWFLLETAARADGFFGVVKAFAATGAVWSRPMLLLYYPIALSLGGMNPLFYQALMLALDVAQGFFFYLLLSRLTGSKQLALSAAVLGLLAPSRAATHFWFSTSAQSLALALALASMVLHARWAESRRGLPWASQLTYLLSALAYESVIFLPLLLFGAYAVKGRARGASWKKSLVRSFTDLLPYAATLLLALFWQWFGVKALVSAENPKSVALSPGHILKALGAGFECVTNRVIHMASTSLVPFFREAGPWALALPAAAGALTWLLVSRRQSDDDRKTALRAALAAAGAGFLGAYLPYALSGSYMPQIYGIMSRTNGAGALITGLLAAAGLYALGESRRKTRGALLAAVSAAFLWTDWSSGLEWTRSWSLQRDILDQASSHVSAVPEGEAVLLTGAPSYYGRAVVFDASYDFSSALRLWSGRSDLKANIVSGRMRFEDKGAVEYLAGQQGALYPYGRTWLFDYGADTLARLDGPPK